MVRTISISGVDLRLWERGEGQTLLFLHPGEGLAPERGWLDMLARHFRVVAPGHPGFGATPLPDWIGTVDDLAYLYLDLARRLELRDAVLVGVGFGGWIAAEMAVRNTAGFARIVLAAPLGIKAGGRDDRDIADVHSMSHEAYLAAAWADPDKGRVDPTKLDEADVRAMVEAREALALFGWKPYMHNPRLKPWLHRIDKPTRLVWGDKDRVVTPAYGKAWVAEIAGARLDVIPDCGHFPHWEQPEAFTRIVRES